MFGSGVAQTLSTGSDRRTGSYRKFAFATSIAVEIGFWMGKITCIKITYVHDDLSKEKKVFCNLLSAVNRERYS